VAPALVAIVVGVVGTQCAPVTVEATEGHPFRVVGAGWVQAAELAPGDHLVTVDGGEAVVMEVTRIAAPADVVNLEVEEDHTYFVGAGHVLVHNNSCGTGTKTKTKVVKEQAFITMVRPPDLSPEQLRQFKRKALALQALGEQGLLVKAEGKVQRDPSVTRQYKRDLTKRVERMYGTSNPGLARHLQDRIRTMSPDHVWELQFGGPDMRANLKMLDSRVNKEFGFHQIRPQIRHLAPGTKIRVLLDID
jgi:hypothetical protein